MKRHRALVIVSLFFLVSCSRNEIKEISLGDYSIVEQSKGPSLGYSPRSGISILEIDGYAFKDLNRNGILDPYEDWRLPVEERAKDLASKMSTEQICGLMIYSSSQKINDEALTDEQISFLKEDHVRHVLVADIATPEIGARWANNVQALCESLPLGIPANNSTDPRNYTNGKANTSTYAHEPDEEFDPDGTSSISRWPREIGMAATFDMDVIRRHGEVVSTEYRALGLTTALSPQADMASDPRWRRFYGTFSEDPSLLRDIVREYCDAFQTTKGSKTGWGDNSVNCMVKHWPGGGTGEGGRDAHFGIGKYAVYPGNNFTEGLVPFVNGAFKLKGKTSFASAVMPYYTISYNQDPSGENVANGFSHYIIQDLLRDKYGYEGVVCTDWGIVKDYQHVYVHKGKPWGVENLSEAERRFKVFEAGVDQLGGVYDNEPSLVAYHLWEEKYGKESARKRFELSAVRLLVNIFNVGVFENPYVSPENAGKIVGCREFVAAGYDAQLKSVVMIKNKGNTLPTKGRLKVYEPLRHVPAGFTHWRKPTPEYEEYPFSKELLGQYYEFVDTPDEADFALVSIKTPYGHWGYISPDETTGEPGHYNPISLQWGPYKADFARERSIAGGDPTEISDNRSYKGYTEYSSNEPDMEMVRRAKALMGDRPVVLVVQVDRPFVPAEIEPYADAILLSFGVCNNALLDVMSGRFEPYGLLPCQLPADMRTVEEQCEDVPHDMRCYVDAAGNSYDFAFGLNWKGVISDSRVEQSRRF